MAHVRLGSNEKRCLGRRMGVQKNGGAEDTKIDPMNVQWGPKGGHMMTF